jgi:hypothetical protein
MELTSHKIQLRKSLIDESFNPDEAKSYRLFIQMGYDFLSTCVMDDMRKKIICLEDFSFPLTTNPEILAEKYEFAKQQSKLLSLDNFCSVNCCVKFSSSTLVPEPFFDSDTAELFWNFNSTENAEGVVATDDLKLIHAKNIFAIPSLIQKMLKYWYYEISIHHHSTALINALLLSYKSDKSVTVNLNSNDFDLVVTAGNKLVFYNCFKYATSEDFLYFLLFSLEQLQLNTESVELKLAGEIDKQSIYYKSLNKYFQKISFVDPLQSFKYSYKFDGLIPSTYFTLFSQFLCES